jgi:hypothetical protein
MLVIQVLSLSISQRLMLFAKVFFLESFVYIFVHTFPKQQPPSVVRAA